MKMIRISSSWCVSCIVMDKLWKELQEKYPYEYREYDYDFDELEIEKYQVGTILPVVIIEKDNQEVTRIIGEKTRKEFFDIIDSLGV